MALLARHSFVVSLLLAALVGALACGPTAPRFRSARGETQQEDTAVGPGDVFEVRVYNEEDLSALYRVEGDGTIDFPLVGRVEVAGLDPSAIAARIRDHLREGQYLVAPHVSVRVEEYNSRRVSVIGAVREPGSYSISSRMGVVEAVSLAGGFTALANRDGTLLTRRIDGELRTFSVPVDRISSGQEPDVTVRAGDILHVPERIF
ncbi:MAG: polysaccharide export protein [Deltaproteobacteria bacterium]|nr:polysaccharide export protein [Deltaproteobacteria bacterium]